MVIICRTSGIVVFFCGWVGNKKRHAVCKVLLFGGNFVGGMQWHAVCNVLMLGVDKGMLSIKCLSFG